MKNSRLKIRIPRLGTIRAKQLMLAVLITIVPLVVVGNIFITISTVQVRSTVKSNLRQITSDKAQSIRQWFQERKADITLLSATRYVQDVIENPQMQAGTEAFQQFWNAFSLQYGSYSNIEVYDIRENLVGTGANESADLSQLAEFASLDKNRATTSEAFLMEGLAHILLSVPVNKEEDRIGRLVVAVKLEALNKITDNMKVGKTGEAYLVNKHGYFVTHRNRARVLTEDHSKVSIIARLISGEEEGFVGEVIDYRRIPVLGAYYYFNELDWGLVAEQDVEEAFEPSQELLRTLVMVITISSLITSLIAYILTSRNLRSLFVLRNTIMRIKSGDISTRFPVTERDEIGLTGEVFNDMLEQLEQTQNKLKSRVEVSDRELLRAHHELQRRHKELQQAQDRLIRSERLSTLGEVAAGLAHEINNPLSTISLLISSLGSDNDLSDGEKDYAIEVITEEIEKIASMIGRFQDLTHPQPMRNEPVVIERVIDRTLALLKPKLNHVRVNVHTEIDKKIPAVVGDERQLGQLLLNLILNSIYAMPDGGDLRIKAKTHKEKESEYLRLIVEDTGAGMSEEVKEKIFSPFFTTRAEGTGLGLLIVSQTAERHGGKVSVESSTKWGTRLVVDLPKSKVNK